MEKRSAAFHAVARGHVQGVGFRYSASAKARELKLVGWVRNCEDGSVELFAEGPASRLDAFEQWLRRGPAGAIVRELLLDRVEPRGQYADFSITF